MKKLLLVTIIILLTFSVDTSKFVSNTEETSELGELTSFFESVAFWQDETEEISEQQPTENTDFISESENEEIQSTEEILQDGTLGTDESPTPISEVSLDESSENESAEPVSVQDTIDTEIIADENTEEMSEEIIDSSQEIILEDSEEVLVEDSEIIVENNIENSDPDSENLEHIPPQDEQSDNIALLSPVEPLYPPEIASTQITVEDWNIEIIDNNYQVEFVFVNLVDSEQDGEIIFSVFFEDGTSIPFDNINATYRFRYQVSKKYNLTLTPSIVQYMEISTPLALTIELISEESTSNEVFLRKIYTLE